MNVDYTCKNEECQHEFPVHYYLGTGIWEEECPECKTEIDAEEIESQLTPDRDAYNEEE